MQLQLLDELREVESRDLEPTKSRSTGRDLRRLTITFRASDAVAGDVTSQLVDAVGAEGALVDDTGGRWIVETHSYSYSNGDGPRRFTADLRQLEELAVTAMEFEDLRFEVLYYSDELPVDADDSLLIIAEFDATPEQATRLQLLYEAKRDSDDPYFELVRHVGGAAEEPLRVRFGKSVWQRLEGEQRRFHMSFVTEEGDRDFAPLGNQPEHDNLERMALWSRETLAALLEELNAAGQLPPDALSRIRQRGDEAWTHHSMDLRESVDVTMYRLS